MKKYAFIDRDGTLIYEPEDTFQIDDSKKLRILDGVIEGLQALQERGFTLIMITNQDGLGTESFSQKSFDAPQKMLIEILEKEGVYFEEILICPHFEEDNCDCRKPKTGLVQTLLESNECDLEESFVYGDRESDRQFAENLGVKYVPMECNGVFNPMTYIPRKASVKRNTNETQVEIDINIDGSGNYQIDTDIGFLSHMLELFAKHGLCDLSITARGDTQYDDHHLIEDVGIALGQAIKQAIGDKKGINRYGFFLLPMDEVLVSSEVDFKNVKIACATDLSGRYAFETNYQPMREKVNNFSTEMVKHFFKSLALNAEMNLHIQFLNSGENEHHRIEGMFKSFARSLRMSCQMDEQARNQLPTTKGKL